MVLDLEPVSTHVLCQLEKASLSLWMRWSLFPIIYSANWKGLTIIKFDCFDSCELNQSLIILINSRTNVIYYK